MTKGFVLPGSMKCLLFGEGEALISLGETLGCVTVVKLSNLLRPDSDYISICITFFKYIFFHVLGHIYEILILILILIQLLM